MISKQLVVQLPQSRLEVHLAPTDPRSLSPSEAGPLLDLHRVRLGTEVDPLGQLLGDPHQNSDLRNQEEDSALKETSAPLEVLYPPVVLDPKDPKVSTPRLTSLQVPTTASQHSMARQDQHTFQNQAVFTNKVQLRLKLLTNLRDHINK